MMRALVVTPGVNNSAALVDVPEPMEGEGDVLLEILSIGVCGTDRDIVAGKYGSAPARSERLVLGHECLARVAAAPEGSGLKRGDLVVPMVRHPDPVPCMNCEDGAWDMCRNGRYTEHGIKELDGFARERVRSTKDRLVRVPAELGDLGVLVEPASVLAKAWEHIERIGRRARFAPRSVLVTGAGPIGLLAALMGAQRGLEVHVLDRVIDGPKPELVRGLGAHYHHGSVEDAGIGFDIVIECTGAAELVIDAMTVTVPNGIACLTGVSSGGRTIALDAGALNRSMVLENNVVFGSVNANRRHYELAVESLSRAHRDWLARLITRREPLEHYARALRREKGDIKVCLEVAS
jgi:threonine dehydrogenase-like Zn-dependent dehydrogenase